MALWAKAKEKEYDGRSSVGRDSGGVARPSGVRSHAHALLECDLGQVACTLGASFIEWRW